MSVRSNSDCGSGVGQFRVMASLALCLCALQKPLHTETVLTLAPCNHLRTKHLQSSGGYRYRSPIEGLYTL